MFRAAGLWEGGADFLLVETSQDMLNVKAALAAIDKLAQDLNVDIPVAVQCTIETMGTTLGGQDIESFYTSLAHRDLLVGWYELLHRSRSSCVDHLRDLIRNFQVSGFGGSPTPVFRTRMATITKRLK